MRDHDDFYDSYFEDDFAERRPASERPGTYWARPATALTTSDQLAPGSTVWHVYLWADEQPRARLVTRVATLAELDPTSDSAHLLPGKWFTEDGWNSPSSCNDASLDGADYNNNYLFASEQDALDAIANRVPRDHP